MTSIMFAVFYRKTDITPIICLTDRVSTLGDVALVAAAYGYPIIACRSDKPKWYHPVIFSMYLLGSKSGISPAI